MIPNALSPLWASAARELSNHLWQSTLFAGVVALLALALRRYPARARYWLWLAASAKFLIPFSLLIAIGSHLAHPTHPTPSQTTTYLAIDEMSQPFTSAPAFTTSIPIAALPTPEHHVSLPVILAATWLCGFAAILASWLIQWRRVAITLRNAPPLRTGRVLETLRRIEPLARISRPIPIFASLSTAKPTTMEPGIFGILRPVLLWPEAISPHLDDAHLEAVLAHEACHVRRRDNLTSLLHMLVEAVFWFHPLVWWIETQLVKERERACDEEVLLLCHQPQVYAESILKVCELCLESPLTCVSGITGADLKQRIVQIMTATITRKLGPASKLLLLTVGLLVAAVPVLAGRGRAMRSISSLIVAPPQNVLPAFLSMPEPLTSNQPAEAMPDAQETATPNAETDPAFEVASIRPAAGAPGSSIGVAVEPSGRVRIIRESVQSLMYFAYLPRVGTGLVQGGPEWTSTQTYDINAKVDDAEAATWATLSDARRTDRVRLMVRTLLAQRFQVKMHTDTQVKPAFALVQAKGGAKLKPVDAPPLNADQEAMEAWQKSGNWSAENAPPGTFLMTGSTWVGKALPISQLLTEIAMNARVDRVVVDETGLKGSYDFTFNASYDKDAPILLDQIESQLGLKLEPRKLPIKIYVIDSAEKPTLDGAELLPTAMVQQSGKPVETAAPAAAGDVQPLKAMASDAHPAFEVAAIKLSDPNESTNGFRADGRHIFIMNQTLMKMVTFAYALQQSQVMGAPEWASAVRYDVDGVPDVEGAPNIKQLREMIRKLLSDRFGLTFHRETRELPVYAISVAKGGAKLTSAANPNGVSGENGLQHGTELTMRFTNSSIADLALNMQLLVDRPIVDRTGLAGTYDFKLRYTVDETRATDPNAPPGLFTAIQEQLGLKLEAVKAPTQMLVIDAVERPSEN